MLDISQRALLPASAFAAQPRMPTQRRSTCAPRTMPQTRTRRPCSSRNRRKCKRQPQAHRNTKRGPACPPCAFNAPHVLEQRLRPEDSNRKFRYQPRPWIIHTDPPPIRLSSCLPNVCFIAFFISLTSLRPAFWSVGVAVPGIVGLIALLPSSTHFFIT